MIGRRGLPVQRTPHAQTCWRGGGGLWVAVAVAVWELIPSLPAPQSARIPGPRSFTRNRSNSIHRSPRPNPGHLGATQNPQQASGMVRHRAKLPPSPQPGIASTLRDQRLTWLPKHPDLAGSTAQFNGSVSPGSRAEHADTPTPTRQRPLLAATYVIHCFEFKLGGEHRVGEVRAPQSNRPQHGEDEMKILAVMTLLVLFGVSSARAVVNCPDPGPGPNPCDPGNPTKTFTWTCADGQTCGSAYCVTICSQWNGFICSGNTGYIEVTFP